MGQPSGWTLGQLGQLLGADVRGPSDLRIRRPVPAGSDDPEGVTFAESQKYIETVMASKVGAVIVDRDSPELDKPSLIVDSPRLAFFKLLALAERKTTVEPGVHPTAVVDANASVRSSTCIGPYVVIAGETSIGDRVQVFPFCYVGPGCAIGEDSRLMPGAVLVQDVSLGPRTVVHPGAVLGADGFGFVWDGAKQVKVPQVGGVEIGSDVEIGANTSIDRATSGETVVSDGVKIDNLVQVGHNSRIGAHTVLAALVGISGSVTLGDRVSVGGQSGFADHLSVVDDVLLAGRTGVFSDLSEPGEYFGVPPRPIGQAMRILALQQRLPELVARIRALEEEVERLKRGD